MKLISHVYLIPIFKISGPYFTHQHTPNDVVLRTKWNLFLPYVYLHLLQSRGILSCVTSWHNIFLKLFVLTFPIHMVSFIHILYKSIRYVLGNFAIRVPENPRYLTTCAYKFCSFILCLQAIFIRESGMLPLSYIKNNLINILCCTSEKWKLFCGEKKVSIIRQRFFIHIYVCKTQCLMRRILQNKEVNCNYLNVFASRNLSNFNEFMI
jgi:hypothetical protein